MVRTTEKDTQDILNLIYHANCCEDMDSFISTICPSMMQIFRSECTTFQIINGYPQNININESRSFKNDSRNLVEDKYYPTLYKDGFFHQSPLLKTALSSPKTVLKIQDSLSQKDWEKSDMYNDFIKPQNLFWELFLPLRWKSKLKGIITLWRPRNQPDYETSDIMKSEILSPHLSLAIRNISRISKINNLEKQSLARENDDDDGLIILDDKLQPIYSNLTARETCLYLFNRMSSGTFDLNKGEFPIPHCVINDCYDLLNLQKTEEQLEWLPKERVIFIKNGKRFRIEYSMIWKTNQTIATPQFMVTFSDLTSENTMETALQAKFHLTHREVDIVLCIMADMSYDDIAEKLFISKLTVHTHIKNVYRKLGVKNKIELFKCVQYPSSLK